MKKRALIIGGSSGIGLATVKKLYHEGFEVEIIHRDRRQQVSALETELKNIDPALTSLSNYNLDGTNQEKLLQCVTEMKEKSERPFDLVLHAISRGNLKPLIGSDRNLNASDLELTIDAMGTNLHSWTGALLSSGLLGEGCQIVVLTSEGNERMWSGYAAVGIAKSALETLAKYLAVELAPMGINVNIIQAGVTDTPSLRMIPEVESLIETSKKRNPKKRLTTPSDVANAIFLLTLPEAAWINGSLIHVDGGEHLI
jgi:enoyl-[acyl-carrier protein] reductase III